MKIMARRKLLYGVLYSAGDVFECGDVEQVCAWVATGAVGLMGAALPERVETQAQGEMAATLEPTSAVSEAELPEREETQARGEMAATLEPTSAVSEAELPEHIEPLESELGASGSAPAQEESMPPAESPDESPVDADAASAETKSTRRRGR
jgi:hypothetical protein